SVKVWHSSAMRRIWLRQQLSVQLVAASASLSATFLRKFTSQALISAFRDPLPERALYSCKRQVTSAFVANKCAARSAGCPCALAGASIRLIDRDIGLAADLDPALRLRLHQLAELLRRHADRLGALAFQECLELRRGQRLADLDIELIDDQR